MPRGRYNKGSQTSTSGPSRHSAPVRDYLDLTGYRYVEALEEDDAYALLLAEVVEHIEVCPNPECGAKGFFESHGSYITEFDDWSHGKRRRIRVEVHRWLCLACGKTCSDELPGLDSDFKATRRLVEEIEKHLDLRNSHAGISVVTHLSVSTIGRIARRLRERRNTAYSKTAPREAGFDEMKFLGTYRFVAANTKDRLPWELLPETTQETIEQFFKGITNPEALMVANMDFTLPIKDVVRRWFPNAVIVIDRYHVMNFLIKCLAKARNAEGRNLVKRAVEELGARMGLPANPDARRLLEDEIRKRAKKQSQFLQRDRHLFNAPFSELSPADQIKVELWLGGMPLLREAYDLVQNMHRLYRHRTRPETAAALMNRWFDLLSGDAMKYLRVFVVRVRKHMPDVCAFWTTHSSNGYTEAINRTLAVIERTRGHIGFDNARDIFLHSESPTSVLRRERAERQEERSPGEKHASVHPRRRLRRDMVTAPRRYGPGRHGRRRKATKPRPDPNQLELFSLGFDPKPDASEEASLLAEPVQIG